MVCVIGLISQTKLWKVVEERRKKQEAEKRAEEEKRDAIDCEMARDLEEKTQREKEEWEAIYGDKKQPSSDTVETGDDGVYNSDSRSANDNRSTRGLIPPENSRRETSDNASSCSTLKDGHHAPPVHKEEGLDTVNETSPDTGNVEQQLPAGERTENDPEDDDTENSSPESIPKEEQEDHNDTEKNKDGKSAVPPPPEVTPLPFTVSPKMANEKDNISVAASIADSENCPPEDDTNGTARSKGPCRDSLRMKTVGGDPYDRNNGGIRSRSSSIVAVADEEDAETIPDVSDPGDGKQGAVRHVTDSSVKGDSETVPAKEAEANSSSPNGEQGEEQSPINSETKDVEISSPPATEEQPETQPAEGLGVVSAPAKEEHEEQPPAQQDTDIGLPRKPQENETNQNQPEEVSTDSTAQKPINDDTPQDGDKKTNSHDSPDGQGQPATGNSSEKRRSLGNIDTENIQGKEGNVNGSTDKPNSDNNANSPAGLSSGSSSTSTRSPLTPKFIEKIPSHTSKIVLSYRTNEWAKHLSEAEPPEVPPIEPSFEEGTELDDFPISVAVIPRLPAASESEHSQSTTDIQPDKSEQSEQSPEPDSPTIGLPDGQTDSPLPNSNNNNNKPPPIRTKHLSAPAMQGIQSRNMQRSLSNPTIAKPERATIAVKRRSVSQTHPPGAVPTIPESEEMEEGRDPQEAVSNSSNNNNITPLMAHRQTMLEHRQSTIPINNGPLTSQQQSRMSVPGNPTSRRGSGGYDANALAADRRRSFQYWAAQSSPSVDCYTNQNNNNTQHRRQSQQSRMTTSVVGQSPGQNEARMAMFRNSVRADMAHGQSSETEVENRRVQMMNERYQTQLGRQQQAMAANYRNLAFDQAMRSGSLQDLHTEAMRRMQAAANARMKS